MNVTVRGRTRHYRTVSLDERTLLASVQRNPFAARSPEILREAHAMMWEVPVKRLSQN